MIGVEVKDGRYVVTLGKHILVMDKVDFVKCLRQGKRWRRRQALSARLAAVTDRTREEESGGQQRGSR
jgi:hypothetical protein